MGEATTSRVRRVEVTDRIVTGRRYDSADAYAVDLPTPDPDPRVPR